MTGDFNKDGNPDVVLLKSLSSASTLSADLFHGDGTGGFRYGATFGSFPGFSFTMRAADVNR